MLDELTIADAQQLTECILHSVMEEQDTDVQGMAYSLREVLETSEGRNFVQALLGLSSEEELQEWILNITSDPADPNDYE